MSDIWLHSDWHLWHENLYGFTYTDKLGQERRVRERFICAVDGDAFIEQEIRRLVKREDHIWFLGDMTMGRENHNADAFVRLMKNLPGHKRLILGNHDHLKPKWYIEAGFQKIKGSNLLDGILMSHYPVHESSLGFRTKLNVHGHIHQNDSPPGPYYNACVEVNEYRPINLDEIKARLR